MVSTGWSFVTWWRKRRQRRDLVRVEVEVRKEDAALIGEFATALLDFEGKTRAILREKIATPRNGGLKALIASAPLDGIDLERPRDFGRAIAL